MPFQETVPSATPAALSAALNLFEAGGPFAADRNPALLLGPGGESLAANAAAAPLAKLLRSPSPDLAAALAGARTGQPVRLAAVEAAGDDGKSLSFDLSLLPCPGPDGIGVLVLGRDISLERALRGALIDSRQRFKELVDAAADFTWEIDADGAFSFVSGPLAMGYPSSELIGRKPQDFAMADDAAAAFSGAAGQGGLEIWMRAADGRALCLLVQGQGLVQGQALSGSAEFRGARGLARDITAQKARETELAEARHRERLVIHLLRSLRRSIDPAEAIATALTTAIQAVGADLGRVARLGVDDLPEPIGGETTPDDTGLIKSALQTKEGVAISRAGSRLGVAFICHHNARRVGVLLLWRDAARGDWMADDLYLLGELAEQLAVLIELRKGQEQLHQLSTTDALTGLLNRRGFETTLARVVERAHHDGQGGALIYVDLDNFKQVNDRFGHAQGDAALVATAEILRNQLRARDPIGRLGGDEFVAWMDDIERSEVVEKAVALQQAAQELIRFAPGSDKPLGFSIGIALLRPGDSLDVLMSRADEAMYRIKHGGKGSYVVVD